MYRCTLSLTTPNINSPFYSIHTPTPNTHRFYSSRCPLITKFSTQSPSHLTRHCLNSPSYAVVTTLILIFPISALRLLFPVRSNVVSLLHFLAYHITTPPSHSPQLPHPPLIPPFSLLTTICTCLFPALMHSTSPHYSLNLPRIRYLHHSTSLPTLDSHFLPLSPLHCTHTPLPATHILPYPFFSGAPLPSPHSHHYPPFASLFPSPFPCTVHHFYTLYIPSLHISSQDHR